MKLLLLLLGVALIPVAFAGKRSSSNATVTSNSTTSSPSSVNSDPCKEFGTCSQVCTNVGVDGSYQCDCINGFSISKDDNSSCELIEKNPTLIIAYNSGIRGFSMTPGKEHLFSIVEGSGSPVSVSYDARQDWIFWTDVMEPEEAIWRSRLNGSDMQQVVNTGLILPEGIAFDWIANNLYFTDSNKSHIVVCTENGGNCTVLIQESMDKPRGLALHPNLGLLFWTDWGAVPSIIRAGMDGSSSLTIIQDNLKWPNGITVDHGNSRIYWTDANTDRIETATLDGEDRHIVRSTGIKHPFGVDVLGDMIFWSDWSLYEIQKSNKFNGSGHEVLVKEPYERFNGLAVVHKANQPITRRNSCENAGCSHICVLGPNNFYRCMCPVGMNLDRRTKICAVNKAWPHFLVSYNNTIKTSPIGAIGSNTFQERNIPGLSSIGAVATMPMKTTIYLSDLEKHKIYSFDLKTSSLTVLVEKEIKFVKGMDYDEVGNNLYWVDSELKTVEVMSLKTMARVVLFQEIDQPVDIVIAPNLRAMFIAEVNDRGGGKIIRFDMDSFNRRVLHRSSSSMPAALTYSKELQRLYWTSMGSETIESVGVDGSSNYIAIARPGQPYGIVAYASQIWWTDRVALNLRGRQLEMHQDERSMYIGNYDAIRPSSTPGAPPHYPVFNHAQLLMAKVTMLNKEESYNQSLLDNHECSPRKNKCPQICLLSGKGYKGTCFPMSTPTTLGPFNPRTRTSVNPVRVDKKDLDEDLDDQVRIKVKKGPWSSQSTSTEQTFNAPCFPKPQMPDNVKMEKAVGDEDVDDTVVVTEGPHPVAIALGVIILLVLVAVIVGIILHRKNTHPKVLVRPYVQHWVRYVNEPVQRFFHNRGEQLDGKKNIYDDVYHNPTADNSYSRPYENIDSINDDSSVHVYEQPPADSHRIAYNPTERLIP